MSLSASGAHGVAHSARHVAASAGTQRYAAIPSRHSAILTSSMTEWTLGLRVRADRPPTCASTLISALCTRDDPHPCAPARAPALAGLIEYPLRTPSACCTARADSLPGQRPTSAVAADPICGAPTRRPFLRVAALLACVNALAESVVVALRSRALAESGIRHVDRTVAVAVALFTVADLAVASQLNFDNDATITAHARARDATNAASS